jgi:aspartokinase-like uncharacterized kinase
MFIIILFYILKFSVNFILVCDVLICNFAHYVDTADTACTLYDKFCIQMALTCMDLLERVIKCKCKCKTKQNGVSTWLITQL